ncbi:dienelactone hydrolase family protein [Iodobacter sp. HSC-16F04]|uniref:Dienelactone hydrolase family protein n=1 Tax=Iodobacter violaceini TaxID=3044271 RepID=A0ABX0L3X2_9NEIS|nr:alpha/beta fold hydrolase [Iodobacter violacea]NHQ88171.1 dienelactone hydrolase family protein [Iodobacter violacea]
MRIIYWLYLLGVFALPAWAERVLIPGAEIILSAKYLPPPFPDAGPAAAVLLLHGCNGLSHSNGINPRPDRMAALLQEKGYAVLMLDSFSARDLQEICSVPLSKRTLSPRMRAEDARHALEWLKARKEIDGDRIGVIGWSHGATSVLALLGQKQPSVRVAVGFFPSCSSYLLRDKYQVTAPLLLLVGEDDDWTPAESCRALVARADQPTFRLITYPDAMHDFDNISLKPDETKRLTLGASSVSIAFNAEASSDAYRRTFKWLSPWLDLNRIPIAPPVSRHGVTGAGKTPVLN